jgi:hypothetical protein
MARTRISAKVTSQSLENQHLLDKNTRTHSLGSRKKRLTFRMDSLALQPISHLAAPEENMGNDQLSPVAEHDYPDGSPMLLPPEARARLLKEHKRSKRHRHLIDDATDVDSNGSQDDRPSHASVSRPSSYHDASSGPAHPLGQHHAAQNHDQHPIGSASSTVVPEPAPL